MCMVKRLIGSLLFVGMVGAGLAQTPKLPPPETLPANATPEQTRAEILAVQKILCKDIDHVGQVITKTGTIAKAVPIVVNMTGMQPADIEAMEAKICGGDPSALSLTELRANNRRLVWILDVHLLALGEVMGK